MQLSVQERRNKILELLHENGRVSVNDLSRLFEVSGVIIRADLAELEKQDLLSRVHGGAIMGYQSYYNMSLVQRSNTNAVEKRAIAAEIATHIHDNHTLLMNAGTTPLFVMRAIAEKKVTILTNSIALALEGASNPNFKIILLGGEVDSNYQFTHGVQVMKELELYRADLLILSVDGIDRKAGLSTFYHQEAEISAKMMRQAVQTIVAADYSKIGRTAFTRIDTLHATDLLVTNHTASPADIQQLKRAGISVITV